MGNIENKILMSFLKLKKGQYKMNELFVSFPDNFYDVNECEIMEKKNYGKVWAVRISNKFTILDIYEIN